MFLREVLIGWQTITRSSHVLLWDIGGTGHGSRSKDGRVSGAMGTTALPLSSQVHTQRAQPREQISINNNTTLLPRA